MKNLISKITLSVLFIFLISQVYSQSFSVIGDYGNGGQTHGPDAKKVADMIKFHNSDFILTVGDNNYPDGEQETLCQNITKNYYPFIDPTYTEADLENCATPNFTGVYNPSNRFYPSPGNHDYDNVGEDAAPYYNYFQGIPHYYDFVRGNVHFFSLNSNTEEPDGVDQESIQAQWLKENLQNSTAKWKIVYLHHTVYTSGSHNGEPGEEDRRWDFKGWGASAVIYGHDHHYERLNIDCLPYFVNGLGGTGIRDVGDPIEGSQFIYNDKHGAMFIDATEDEIVFNFYAVVDNNDEGELIDSYTIESNYSFEDCDIACCPEGTVWDGANCLFDFEIEDGYQPFIWQNKLYTSYGPNGVGDCPEGTVDDGANCYFGISYPSDYEGFISNNQFFTEPNCSIEEDMCCPPGSTWDGANCYYDLGTPSGFEPFIGDDNGLYVHPDKDGNCPPDTEITSLGCYLGVSIPNGLDGFVYNNHFYANENCNIDACCPEGTMWDGETCVLEIPWDGELLILPDNRIAIIYDEDKGCPPGTIKHPSEDYCITNKVIPPGFEGEIIGNNIGVFPDCETCCPEGFQYDGENCVKYSYIYGSEIMNSFNQTYIQPDCKLFYENDCCPRGFNRVGDRCILDGEIEGFEVDDYQYQISLFRSPESCLDRATNGKHDTTTPRAYVESNILDNKDLELFPNPTMAQINFTQEIDWGELRQAKVYNTNGEVVHSISQKEINDKSFLMPQNITPGIYYITFTFENKITTKKIMKL